MFEDFLNHKCNIYHQAEEPVNAGYGIKAGSTKQAPQEAHELDVPCHFHLKMNNYLKLVQKEPYASVEGEDKLSLPAGTDIRKNDIVEDLQNGLRFRAGVPKTVHGGHHIIVTITREEGPKHAL